MSLIFDNRLTSPQVAQYVSGIWAGLLFSVDHDVLSVRWTNDLPVILWFEERCGADENKDSVLIGLIGHFADNVPISFTISRLVDAVGPLWETNGANICQFLRHPTVSAFHM
ncbi:unnamed protein product [Clonostachys solani]|uniref:Uncharacterized protein n=1 Tax=Clonostachys solani TaxID=160281 RepID=A0A9N9Z9U5_9HYPO|nr:unnamed protein product [Clonostachys solani]